LVEGVEWQGEAIPDEMPMGFRNEGIPQVEDIGEPITAGFLTQSVNDPTNWYSNHKCQPIVIVRPNIIHPVCVGGCLRSMMG